MSDSSDPVSEIVATGREVIPEDVEALWSDLMDRRSTAQETAARARVLMETLNVAHLANWGLSTLYALTNEGVRDTQGVGLAHQRWRRHVRDYKADPAAWDRRYYQRMIISFADRHGLERARAFGAKLVASGELRDRDVAAALGQDPRVE